MQPTMKLRWLRLENSSKSDPAVENGYGEKLVLQQLWIAPEGALNTPDEWRDIEIAEE